MRPLFAILATLTLSACNFDNSLVIETPEVPNQKAEVCRSGVVYTVDDLNNVNPKIVDGKMAVCRRAPSSMEQMDDNSRWEKEGVRLDQTEYADLF